MVLAFFGGKLAAYTRIQYNSVICILIYNFLYLYTPGRSPAAPTHSIPPVDCCASPFLLFFGPRGVFWPSKADRRRRLANMTRRARGVTSVSPCSPPHPSYTTSYPLIVDLVFFCSFWTQKMGRQHLLAARRRQTTKFRIRE